MRTLILVISLWVGAASAQSYPDYKNTTVNDFANLLTVAEEDSLSSELRQLKRDTGVEMTVLTLTSQSVYAPEKTLESFATGLFNYWGIGDAKRNDGVLVLVIKDDRAMRVELGTAYARSWDQTAERVIDDHFLPAFRAEDYPRGIRQGSKAVINEIVMPFLEGDSARKQPDPDSYFLWLFGAFALASTLHSNRRTVSDMTMRFRNCPNCGRRGLRADRSVSVAASQSAPGRGRRKVYCLYCDHATEVEFTIARRSSSSFSGGFGGGSSGGGGGSGRW